MWCCQGNQRIGDTQKRVVESQGLFVAKNMDFRARLERSRRIWQDGHVRWTRAYFMAHGQRALGVDMFLDTWNMVDGNRVMCQPYLREPPIKYSILKFCYLVHSFNSQPWRLNCRGFRDQAHLAHRWVPVTWKMHRKLPFVRSLANSYSKHLMACSMPGTVAVLRIVTLLVTALMRPILWGSQARN